MLSIEVKKRLRAFLCIEERTAQALRAVSQFAVPALLLVPVPVSAQNHINTVAGGGVINPSPLQADLPGPTATVEDGSGNLYIAAPNAQWVFKLSNGNVVAFAGKGYLSYHGMPTKPATLDPLWSPSGLAVDSQGNVYIADTGNNAIRKVDTSGTMTTVAGTAKPCLGTYCGDGGSATKAQLNAPQGVAVNSAGDIYIADTGDNRIRCVVMVAGGCNGSKLAVGTIFDYAGDPQGNACPSPTSPCGDGGNGYHAQLNSPMRIALDKNGNLYIADTGDNRVRKVDTQHVVHAYAGTGTRCVPSTSACGDTGPATAANLSAPRAVSVDGSGNAYIADTADHRIRLVSAGEINTFAGSGVSGFSGDGQTATNARLAAPNGVYVDTFGNVFISDTGNQRVREIAAGGNIINTILGGGNGGDGAAAHGTYATLGNPYSVAIDSSNNYYIVDTSNNRVRVVNTQSSAITVASVLVPAGAIATVAGNGDAGYRGDNGPATAAALNSPFGAAVDSSGNIFIADSYNGVVREVDGATGIITTVSATNATTLPSSLSFDSSGNLFIADPGAQKIWELSGGVLSTAAGSGSPGFSGDGGPAIAAQLNGPFGVAVDGSNNLYIADSHNNRIRCVLGVVGGCGDTTGLPAGDIVTYAYNGEVLFQGDGGLAINASRWIPNEVAVDSRGNLFIGGGNDALVQRVDRNTGIIVTVAGIDTEYWFYGFTGDGQKATVAHIDNIGLAVDAKENLLIADAGNNRIREVPMIGVAGLSSTSLNFGNQAVGTTSPPQVVTLTNTGADDLAFTSISRSGDFGQSNTCTAASPLAPSQSCTISITFTPTATGTRTGKITISDNGWASPQVIKLSGSGN
jgi:trimeric autotransporter adhesin